MAVRNTVVLTSVPIVQPQNVCLLVAGSRIDVCHRGDCALQCYRARSGGLMLAIDRRFGLGEVIRLGTASGAASLMVAASKAGCGGADVWRAGAAAATTVPNVIAAPASASRARVLEVMSSR